MVKKETLTRVFRSEYGRRPLAGSIYGESPDYPVHWGCVQAIGIGCGGDGDPEYSVRDANREMLSNREMVEVPSPMTVKQFLDVFTSHSD